MSAERLLDGKVAVVTGAGRGIGRAIAILMAQQGAKVVVNDIGANVDGGGSDATLREQVVEEIRAAGGEAVGSADSVADWDGAQAIVQTAIDTFGRIDAVVNNAGNLRDVIFHKMTPDDWDSVLKVHLYGAFYVSRAAAGYFREQESGAYVHMTSASGLIGAVGQANYSAAKIGIHGLSRSIALDMARFNVRSNCISPTAFGRMTETIPASTPEEREKFLELRRRTQRPEQVAPVAAFLASDAAKDITGQIIGVRGNEVYLYNQPRPIRTLHRSDGWTPQSLAEQLAPAWKTSFTPLERSRNVFAWSAI